VFGARSKAALLREFADYLEPADAVSQPR